MSTYAGRAVLPALISDNRGNALPGINVTVYNRGTTVKPTLYTDRTKDTELANPFLTDAYGNVFPYVDPGEYDMLVNGVTIPFSVVNDPAEPVDSEIGDLSITNAKVAADAAIAQSKIDGLVADLAGKEPSIPPGTYVEMIALAGNPDLLIAGAITRDANDAATSAPVVWPDGTPGTYTATTVSTAFPGAVDAYTITYGSPVTLTYTQPAVTRNSNGAVTIRPAITVA